MKQRTKLAMMTTCLVLLIAVIGVTIAFYSNQGGSIKNTVTTKSSSVYLQELFDPEDYWLPGETKQKELNFGNQGERDQVIRFRIETQWLSESGGGWEPTTEKPATINWTNAFKEEWTSPDDKGWHYYKKVLPADKETTAVMESVTFSTNLTNDSQIGDATKVTYRIVIYMEAVDADSRITNASWDKTFTGETDLQWED